MSMTLRLDTAGLRQMIEDNPEFKIEIQQSVINNIKSDNIENAVRDRITTVLKEMAVNEGNYYSPKLKIVDKTLLAAISSAVALIVNEVAETQIKNRIDDLITGERLALRKELKTLLKEYMIESLTPEMAKEILISKLV